MFTKSILQLKYAYSISPVCYVWRINKMKFCHFKNENYLAFMLFIDEINSIFLFDVIALRLRVEWGCATVYGVANAEKQYKTYQ